MGKNVHVRAEQNRPEVRESLSCRRNGDGPSLRHVWLRPRPEHSHVMDDSYTTPLPV